MNILSESVLSESDPESWALRPPQGRESVEAKGRELCFLFSEWQKGWGCCASRTPLLTFAWRYLDPAVPPPSFPSSPPPRASQSLSLARQGGWGRHAGIRWAL